MAGTEWQRKLLLHPSQQNKQKTNKSAMASLGGGRGGRRAQGDTTQGE